MKFTKSLFSISILTFFVGCLAVWLIGLMPNSKEVPSNSSASIKDFQTFTPVEPIPAVIPERQPRFTSTYIACGFGSWRGYVTNDGQTLVQGSKGFDTPKKASAELKKRIKEAVRIVEHIPNYKGFDKVVGERIILINPPDKNGKETASILWYNGGQFISSIDAPSLELALEFESEQRRLLTDSRFRQLRN
jgi:hypothetical protein